jgi:hypothetical protein
VTYRRIRGAEHTEVTDTEATTAWCSTPHDCRMGQDGGSFIIFQRDARGYLTSPTIYKPVNQGDPECASDPDT